MGLGTKRKAGFRLEPRFMRLSMRLGAFHSSEQCHLLSLYNNKLSFYDNFSLWLAWSYMPMKPLSVPQKTDENTDRLPGHTRYLCLLVCVLLVASSLFELWIMQIDWFNGTAFQEIYEGYRQYYPELGNYTIGGTGMYIATLLLDYLNFLPYYASLLLAAGIFYRFSTSILWDPLNIRLLKLISLLLIIDACFPAIKNTLQILSFTSSGKLLFIASAGFSAEGIRTCIIGLSIYTFSMILTNAKKLADESKLIV